MVNKCNVLIRKIDTFGISQTFLVGKEDKFKTVTGGIATLISFAISVMYTLFLLYQMANYDNTAFN